VTGGPGSPVPGAATGPAPGAPSAADSRGWRAVAIVLVGAFMALLDSDATVFN
jgi:hypothetical protein